MWRRVAWAALIVGIASIGSGYASDSKFALNLPLRSEDRVPFISIEQNEDRSAVRLVCVISVEYTDNQPRADLSISLGMKLAFWNSDGFGTPFGRSVWQEKLPEERCELRSYMFIASGRPSKSAHYDRIKRLWIKEGALWQQRLNHKLALQRTNLLSDGLSSVAKSTNELNVGAIGVESERFNDLDSIIHRYPGTSLSPQFNDLVFKFTSGVPSLSKAGPTEHSGSYSTTNSDAGKPRGNAPVEPLCTFVAAILGVPLFITGLIRERLWMYFCGLGLGAGGLGWFLADWLSGTTIFS